MNPRIDKIIANDNHTFHIAFLNGEKRIFDLKPFLNKGKFKELQDINNFKRYKLEDGVINWYNELDISPDTVYLISQKLETE